MSYGCRITNSLGSLIISEDYSNYLLVEKGVIARNTNLPAPTGSDLYFVRPALLGDTIWRGSDGLNILIGTYSGNVEYALVRRNPAQSSETYGLRVRNANGSLAFDSGRLGLIPVSTARTASTMTINQPFPPMAGRKRYVSVASLRQVGIAESGVGAFDYFLATNVRWDSDMSMYLFVDQNGGTAPGGTDFPQWAGTMIYSFADI